jgi:hypothetical protein
VKEKTVAKRLAAIIYLMVVIIFCSALIQGVSIYAEVQRAEVSLSASVENFDFSYDENFANISVLYLFDNPSRLDLSVYYIGATLEIYNTSRNGFITLGLLTERVLIKASTKAPVSMALEVDRKTNNSNLQLALETMHLYGIWVPKSWRLSLVMDYYVIPYNFINHLYLDSVLRK